MRDDKTTLRHSKMTMHFAEVKAIVFVTMRHLILPVGDTQWIYGVAVKKGREIGVHVSYKLTLEALRELQGKGMVGCVGNSYGLYWWSIERLQ